MGSAARIGPTKLTFPSIEFNKKPGKLTYVKAIKDPSVPRDDFYKSGTIHVGAGEPASSRSRRTPKGKSGRARPITQGRLIPKPKDKDGSQKTSRPTVPIQSRPIPSRPIPKQSAAPSRHQTQHNGVQPQAIKQPVAAINGYGQKEKRPVPSPAAVATTPPAPPAPPQSKPLYKAIYDFRPSGAAGEIEGGVDAGESLEALSEQVINGTSIPAQSKSTLLLTRHSRWLAPSPQDEWHHGFRSSCVSGETGTHPSSAASTAPRSRHPTNTTSSTFRLS